MFEREATLYAFTLGYLHRLAADIDEAQLSHQPAPAVKPPVWILGHLAVSTDYGAQLLGLPAACPAGWHARYGMGSPLPAPGAPQPTKAELLAAIDAGHARVTQAACEATAEQLDRPHSFAALSQTPLKTVGDLLAHLMSTHESFHVSQLSTWRRLMGHAPLF